MDYVAVDVSAGGAFDLPDAGASGWFGGAAIKAGVDAATAVFTEKTTGKFLGAVSAGIQLADSITPGGAVRYIGGVQVTVTGTTPKVVMYQG